MEQTGRPKALLAVDFEERPQYRTEVDLTAGRLAIEDHEAWKQVKIFCRRGPAGQAVATGSRLSHAEKPE